MVDATRPENPESPFTTLPKTCQEYRMQTDAFFQLRAPAGGEITWYRRDRANILTELVSTCRASSAKPRLPRGGGCPGLLPCSVGAGPTRYWRLRSSLRSAFEEPGNWQAQADLPARTWAALALPTLPFACRQVSPVISRPTLGIYYVLGSLNSSELNDGLVLP